MSKKGFTLLEMLVATCLLGVLVTILTMVFNQSSIAWRTGKAGVADMSQGIMRLSAIDYAADNILPSLSGNETYCIASPWDDSVQSDSTRLMPRGICKLSQLSGTYRKVPSTALSTISGFNFNRLWQSPRILTADASGSVSLNKVRNYIVGVKSWGPDGVANTKDDITTWPEETDFNAK